MMFATPLTVTLVPATQHQSVQAWEGQAPRAVQAALGLAASLARGAGGQPA